MRRRRTAVVRAALALLAAGAATLPCRSARAEPTVWARARDPARARLAEVLDRVDAMLGQAQRARRAGPAAAAIRLMLLRDASAELGALQAREQREPQARWRVGRLELEWYDLEPTASHLELAIAALDAAVAGDMPEPMLGEAWNELAIAHARLGNHALEIAAYDQALRFEPHPEERGVLLANRAEGLMALGEIRAAVAGYRAALAATPGYALGFYGVTTWWGLAVALDRAGDLSGAMSQIALARAYDPEDRRLSSDSWFYLPDHDRYWYAALGRWYDARHAADAGARLGAYDQAIVAWRSYLDNAPATDRWRLLAGARLRQCELERRRKLDAAR